MKSKFYLHFMEEYFKTKQRIMKKFQKKLMRFLLLIVFIQIKYI